MGDTAGAETWRCETSVLHPNGPVKEKWSAVCPGQGWGLDGEAGPGSLGPQTLPLMGSVGDFLRVSQPLS